MQTLQKFLQIKFFSSSEYPLKQFATSIHQPIHPSISHTLTAHPLSATLELDFSGLATLNVGSGLGLTTDICDIQYNLQHFLQQLIDKNTIPDFQTIALNSLAIRLRSEDLHHLILGNGVPKLQG